MKKKTSIFLLVAALFAAIAVPTWAVGVMPAKMTDIYMDSIYENETAAVADFSKVADMTVTSGDVQVALPAAGEDSIAVSREMESGVFDMQIGLPSTNEHIALLSDKAVYDENGYTQAVQVADSDIHIVTSVLNDEAQSEFAYNFALPAGAYMEYADYGTDNSVLIYNEAGKAVYTLVPGIAKDANGKDVDFVWDLQEDTLVYGIADGQELAYPVNISVNAVAVYGIDHYFTYHKSSRNDKGNIITLKPNGATLYAVTTPPGFSSHKAASWAAVYEEYYPYYWWSRAAESSTITSSLKAQYECHYNYCPNDTTSGADCYTWDIETWRRGTPDPRPVDWGGNGCNPD